MTSKMTTMEVSGYSLSQETISFMELLEEKGFNAPYSKFTIDEARRRSLAVSKYFQGEYQFTGEISELFVPSPVVSGGIPVTVYSPPNLPITPSIFVFFHGGGWVVGSRAGRETLCRKIASLANCIVLNVEYRLAPENKFPACNDDAAWVMRWVLQNKSKLGGLDESRVGVGGDSGGAAIAATVCQEAQGIDFQVLVYPKVDPGQNRVSYKEFATGPVVTNVLLDWFYSQWLSRQEDYEDVRCNPINREGCENLPPALFIVAECDPLRDDSYDYQKKLEKVGVKTELVLINGACHGFFHMIGHFKNSCEKSVTAVVEFIKKYS